MEFGALKKNRDKEAYSIASDVAGRKILFVNYYMIGERGAGNPWVLIDAGLQGSALKIIKDAQELFGENNPPQAILLTHGHFDHVGALPELLDVWKNVPVYAHALEVPYLTGKSSYPPPDPAVGGGAMAYMSWIFPIKPINIIERLRLLPHDGSVPHLPDWKWIHTPGHAPGHVSFFRSRDRVLIAGDAFVTTDQNALSAVLLQKLEMHGPPAYFTINWIESERSIRRLLDLNPGVAGTGHGLPMAGQKLIEEIQNLLENFEEEVPENGRYVKQPAITNEEGIKEMPAPISYNVPRYAALGMLVIGAIGLGYLLLKGKKEEEE